MFLYDNYRNVTKSRMMAACVIRLAGHDALDYYTDGGRNTYGGSDGCLDLNNTINEGLVECINNTGIIDVYDKTCGSVSLADFIVIAAEAMMYRLSESYSAN